MSIGMAGWTIRMIYDIGNRRRYIDTKKYERIQVLIMKIPPIYDVV